MGEPGSPEYDPTAGASGAVTDPGSAPALGADLFEIHRSGVVVFPLIATRLNEQAAAMLSGLDGLSAFTGSVQGEAAVVMRSLTDLHDLLFAAVNDTSIACQDTGTALVQIAATYAASDEAASEEFARLLAEAPSEFADPLPPITPADPDAAGSGQPYYPGAPV